MNKNNVLEFVKKYTMVIVLVGVFAMFAVTTSGDILLPANISNIISQNAYVFILATGMLLCILTGGNIDLSVGSSYRNKYSDKEHYGCCDDKKHGNHIHICYSSSEPLQRKVVLSHAAR